MRSSTSQNSSRRIALPALAASCAAGLIATLFGLSEGLLYWQREPGFEALDLWRIVTAAGAVAGLPALAAALLAASLDRFDDDDLLARALFWTTPVLATATGVVFWTLAEPSAHAPEPPWMLLGAAALVLVAGGWRLQFFERAPAAAAPFGWLATAATFTLIFFSWGPTRVHFRGAHIYLLAAAVLSATMMVLGMYATQGHTSRRQQCGALAACAAAMALGAGWLPWVLPDLYGYLKFIGVFTGAVATAYMSWVVVSHTQRRWHVVPAGVGAVLLLVSLVGLWWFSLRPVAERFGPYARTTMVGLSAQLMSIGDDEDGDGYYASAAGGNDLDDSQVSVRPPALIEPPLQPNPPEAPAGPGATHPTASAFARAEPLSHVVIVVVDSIRADIFNDATLRGRFSFLDRLEAESVRFAAAYAPSNATRLSFPPMLTGLEPSLVASMRPDGKRHHDAVATYWLGRLVEPEGLSAVIIASTYRWMHEMSFSDSADFAINDPSVNRTGHSSPLLELHIDKLFDTGFFGSDKQTVTAIYAGDPHPDFRCMDGSTGGYACYLDEIAMVDRALEHLYRRLEAAGVLEQTLFVVTADHGQSFGNLNYQGHASSLDEETIRVGLMMRIPGEPRRVVDQPVSLMALPATAADALHRRPARPLEHSSLLRFVGDDASQNLRTSKDAEPVMVEHWRGHYDQRPVHKTAFIYQGYKLEYDWHTTATVLVDLDEPVVAGSDVSEKRPQLVEQLRERMFEWRSR